VQARVSKLCNRARVCCCACMWLAKCDEEGTPPTLSNTRVHTHARIKAADQRVEGEVEREGDRRTARERD
jgi:hypothetical protein